MFKNELILKQICKLNIEKDKGFTLIELLVVVIIIGILAAVAIPNLFRQVEKGRQAEAKNNLGAINRLQQATRLENSVFGVIEQSNSIAYIPDNPATLAINEARPGVPRLPIAITGDNYFYEDLFFATTNLGNPVSGGQRATAIARFANELVDYATAVGQQNNGTFISIICESGTIDGAAVTPAPTEGTATSVPSCAVGTRQL